MTDSRKSTSLKTRGCPRSASVESAGRPKGKYGYGVHRVLERAPRSPGRGAGGGVRALEHLLVEEVGEPLEQVQQRRGVVVVVVVVVVVSVASVRE